MTAAVLALYARGTSVLRNIGNWRVKETDRLAAMAAELQKLGPGAKRVTVKQLNMWAHLGFVQFKVAMI